MGTLANQSGQQQPLMYFYSVVNPNNGQTFPQGDGTMSVAFDSQHFSAGGAGQPPMYPEQDSYMPNVQMGQMAPAIMPAGQGMILVNMMPSPVPPPVQQPMDQPDGWQSQASWTGMPQQGHDQSGSQNVGGRTPQSRAYKIVDPATQAEVETDVSGYPGQWDDRGPDSQQSMVQSQNQGGQQPPLGSASVPPPMAWQQQQQQFPGGMPQQGGMQNSMQGGMPGNMQSGMQGMRPNMQGSLQHNMPHSMEGSMQGGMQQGGIQQGGMQQGNMQGNMQGGMQGNMQSGMQGGMQGGMHPNMQGGMQGNMQGNMNMQGNIQGNMNMQGAMQGLHGNMQGNMPGGVQGNMQGGMQGGMPMQPGGMPTNMGSMQGNMQGGMPGSIQGNMQQQQPPQQSQQPSSASATGDAGAAASPNAVQTKRKGLINKKIEKPQQTPSPAPTRAAGLVNKKIERKPPPEPMPEATSPSTPKPPPEEPFDASFSWRGTNGGPLDTDPFFRRACKQDSTSASVTDAPAKPSAHPAPLQWEKAETSPTPVAAGPVLQAAAVPPVQSAATPDGNKTVSENPRPRALPDVPAPPSNRWPLTGGAFSSGDGKYSQFASSIKALNLEPMRANPSARNSKNLVRQQPLDHSAHSLHLTSHSANHQAPAPLPPVDVGKSHPVDPGKLQEQLEKLAEKQTSTPAEKQPPPAPSQPAPEPTLPSASTPPQQLTQHQQQPQVQAQVQSPTVQQVQQNNTTQSSLQSPTQPSTMQQSQPAQQAMRPPLPQTQQAPTQPTPSQDAPITNQQSQPMPQHPQMMGQLPMQMQPVPQPMPQQPGSSKSKSVKLKNAALARPTNNRVREEVATPAPSLDTAGDTAEPSKPSPEPSTETAARREDDSAGAGETEADSDVANQEATTIQEAATPMRKQLETVMEDQSVTAQVMPFILKTAEAFTGLAPPDKVFDRNFMLRIWRVNKSKVHDAVKGLSTGPRPGEGKDSGGGLDRKGRTTRPRDGSGTASHSEHEPSRSIFGAETSKSGKKPNKEKSRMVPSETGYKVKTNLGREEEIERSVRGLLNRICPENLKTIVDRLAEIQLNRADELEFVIRIIFQKALAEPHYCETYADMVFSLRNKYPEFSAEQENEKPQSFTRVLLNTVQNEFESLPTSMEPTAEEKIKYPGDELTVMMSKRKGKVLANMRFIGHLFLRQLLAVKVIGQVVHDLIGIQKPQPEEHMIECVCELLQAIGHTLDSSDAGKPLMKHFYSRLKELKGSKLFPKRIECLIQDLLDLRDNAWQKKLFKEQAQTKDDIRKAAMKEQKAAAKGGDSMFTTKIAGERPAYIDESKKPRAQAKESNRPSFDVRKLFHYFSEDKNSANLDNDWRKAQLSNREAKLAIEWLIDAGFNDIQKEDVVAEMIAELVIREAVSWTTLVESLDINGLQDMKMDVPQADVFFHSLFGRLLASARDFNPLFLRCLEVLLPGGAEFAWTLVVGALKKLKRLTKDKGVRDGVRPALDIKELSSLLEKCKRCSQAEVRRHLLDEGVL